MTKLKTIAWTVALSCILYGGLGVAGVPVEEYARQAWAWVQPGSAKLVGAVILEESADRPKLPASQIIALTAAPGLGIAVVDKDVLGKAKQPALELQPYLDAAKDKSLPQLVRKWGGGSITSVDCPATTDELRKLTGQ